MSIEEFGGPAEVYDAFAGVYDPFMDNIPYDVWAARLTEILKENGIADGLVCDLGCGTGSMTELLARAGYDMIGIDLSDRMLQAALEKREAGGYDILYLQQDMREFELYGTVRAVVCVCDSINYISDTDDLLRVFRLVNNYLDPGGLFLFDFRTDAAYAAIGSRTIAENRDEGSLIWENEYDPDTRINTYALTLFLPEGDGLYRKEEELHRQRAYAPEEIRALLEEAGLAPLSFFDGYTARPAGGRSERVLAAAREIMKQKSIVQ